MSQLSNRLLASLPSYLDKKPGQEPALTLQYDGTSLLSIERRFLTVKTGDGETLRVGLTGLSLSNLVSTLNAQPGFTATLLTDGTLPAISLLEVQDQDLDAEPKLSRFTSLLWA